MHKSHVFFDTADDDDNVGPFCADCHMQLRIVKSKTSSPGFLPYIQPHPRLGYFCDGCGEEKWQFYHFNKPKQTEE